MLAIATAAVTKRDHSKVLKPTELGIYYPQGFGGAGPLFNL